MKITPLNDLFVVDSGALNTVFTVKNDIATLFDTCLNKDNARKLSRAVNFNVGRIINTHSHADHIGGNSFFENKFNCKSFINKREISFCYFPELEPALLYGGCHFSASKSRFLCATGFNSIDTLENIETDIEIVELFGHSPGHTGFLINNVLYAGDALFSKEVIDKHKILYLYDVENFVYSLKKIKSLNFEYIVFCHKGIIKKDEAIELISENIAHTEKVCEEILHILKFSTMNSEEISSKLMQNLNIPFETEYFLLVSSTIKGYLSYLEKNEKIAHLIDKGVKWKRV